MYINIFAYNSFSKYFFKVLQNQFALMGFEQIASSKFKQKSMLFVGLLCAGSNNNKYQIPISNMHIAYFNKRMINV